MVGTACFASLNAHYGYELSRRDDIESLAYMLIYLANGDLPWRNIEATTKEERYDKIMQAKEVFHKSDILYKVPREFTMLLKESRKIEYTEKPNYRELKGLLE